MALLQLNSQHTALKKSDKPAVLQLKFAHIFEQTFALSCPFQTQCFKVTLLETRELNKDTAVQDAAANM